MAVAVTVALVTLLLSLAWNAGRAGEVASESSTLGAERQRQSA
ncbi:MAG: hypothetical protein ACRDU8_03960 [Egibacteraceae bacterium]